MQEILEKLFEMSDEKYKEFNSNLCPNINNIIGVRIPKLREMAKEIAKENPKQFLEKIDTSYYETTTLYGLVIGYMKASLEEKQKYLDIFVPNIDNWSTCDCCCATYKFTNKNLPNMWEYIKKHLKSDKEFELRFAIIMLMDYYLKDEYIDLVFKEIDDIKHEGYYVKMAIAWLISVAFVKYEEKTRKFLKNNMLDDFTYNKSLQKIIESNRINAETKNEIRKMKRK